VLRLILDLDGEIVTRCRSPISACFIAAPKKLIEHKTYLQALPYFDRLDYVAPMNQEHAFFAWAIEKLLGLEGAQAGPVISACCSPRSAVF